jgi:L-asparaginase
MVEHWSLMTKVAEREVVVLAAGGTIAMRADSQSGATPALGAEELASGLSVRARSVRSLPGVQLSLEDALAVVREAAQEAAAGHGVVVTTGTDTLEELAVLADVVCGGTVVFTGAIRPAGTPGEDGPANLLDAVAVARTGPDGTWVVFGGEIHAAREARKVDSVSPRAFGSPRTGPAGFVSEGHVRLDVRPTPDRTPLDVTRLDFRVPIVGTWLGDDGALLRAALDARPDGVVVVALGAGHVPPAVLELVEDAAASVPVVACVRPERGALLRATYGFRGAERDLRAAGVIPAATASPQAARMRLLAALGAGLSGEALVAALADLG